MGSCASAPVEHPPTKQGLLLFLRTADEKLGVVRKQLQVAQRQLEKDADLPANFQDIQLMVFLNQKRILLDIHDHLNKLDELSGKLVM